MPGGTRAPSVLIGVICLVLGAILGPPLVATASETLKHVIVDNDTTQPVPIRPVEVTEVAGSVRTTGPALRQYHGTLTGGIDDTTNRFLFPDDIVVTDIVVEHFVGPVDTPCAVWLLWTEGEFFGSVLQPRVSQEDREWHLSLQSGIDNSGPKRYQLLARTEDCTSRYLVTGHAAD